jgi:hypothetical protein
MISSQKLGLGNEQILRMHVGPKGMEGDCVAHLEPARCPSQTMASRWATDPHVHRYGSATGALVIVVSLSSFLCAISRVSLLGAHQITCRTRLIRCCSTHQHTWG